ncbi:hypothetical protein [Rhizobium esperanzae]|uniref:Uncharacterized protein n=1 Tax=Rhizobium esperanzae TaxID=1967781 RepID=A0A7W6R4I2_9HYPH|nr:hypothetical protein [Rhizobium esperanzae]MBB4236660.1 hypothetical protein [Rhizobium esperanzae]
MVSVVVPNSERQLTRAIASVESALERFGPLTEIQRQRLGFVLVEKVRAAVVAREADRFRAHGLPEVDAKLIELALGAAIETVVSEIFGVPRAPTAVN